MPVKNRRTRRNSETAIFVAVNSSIMEITRKIIGTNLTIHN
jgi:hypothetical protein